MTEPRTTPLSDRHAALGASFTDFGGWSMPVRYTSDLAEHHAVRTTAGLFDISHMAEFTVDGPDAGAFLDFALAGRLSTMPIGKAKYSLVLAESGGIVDDVIVYHLADDSFLVIANAGNRDAVAEAFTARVERFGASGDALRVEDASDSFALLAVQGPQARAIVDATDGISALERSLDDVPYYAAVRGEFAGAALLIARTGYTGEDGYELLVPVTSAPALWDALIAAGETNAMAMGCPSVGLSAPLVISPTVSSPERIAYPARPARRPSATSPTRTGASATSPAASSAALPTKSSFSRATTRPRPAWAGTMSSESSWP